MADVEVNDEALAELLHDPEGPVGRIMERAAFAVENEVKRELLEPGTGRTYDEQFRYRHVGEEIFLETYGSRAPHRASEPGRPASSDTGLLINTVTHYMEETEDGPVEHVGSPSKVMLFVELGTREVPPPGPHDPGHHGMLPRPTLRPALDVLDGADLS